MKPTKNRVYCIGCRHPKMLFETQAKADNFIKFNRDEIASLSGKVPSRSYYCSFCCAWHVTSVDNEGEAVANDIRDKKTWYKIRDLRRDKLPQTSEGQKLSEMLVFVHSLIQKCQRQLSLTNLTEALKLFKEIVIDFSVIEDMASRQWVISSRIDRVNVKIKMLQNTFDIIDEYDIDSDTRKLFLSKSDSSYHELATRYLRNKEKRESKNSSKL